MTDGVLGKFWVEGLYGIGHGTPRVNCHACQVACAVKKDLICFPAKCAGKIVTGVIYCEIKAWNDVKFVFFII
jgi:hypothetical protein